MSGYVTWGTCHNAAVHPTTVYCHDTLRPPVQLTTYTNTQTDIYWQTDIQAYTQRHRDIHRHRYTTQLTLLKTQDMKMFISRSSQCARQ